MAALRAAAVLAAGAAAAAAAAAAAPAAAAACPSGAWHGPAAPFTWVPDPGCEPTLSSPDVAAAAWCGRELVFVGDSTTREFVYDTALWLAGCAVPPLPPAPRAAGGGSPHVCTRVERLRTLRNVTGAVFELPCEPDSSSSSGDAGAGTMALRYLRVEQLRTLTRKPWWAAQLARWTAAAVSEGSEGAPRPSRHHVVAVVLNAGLWNLRHDGKVAPPAGPGPDPDAVAGWYVVEVDALLAHLAATLTPAARAALARVLVWRTMLPLEARVGVTVGAFTRARVAAANAATAPRWAAAGYRVLDVWRYGVHAAWPDLGGAGDAPADAGAPPPTLGRPVDLGDGLPPPALARDANGSTLLLTRDAIHFTGPVNVEMARGLLTVLAAGAAPGGGGVTAAGGGTDDGAGSSGSWAWWPWAAGDGALPPPPSSSSTTGGGAGDSGDPAVSPWLAAAAVAVSLGVVAGRLRSHHVRRAGRRAAAPTLGDSVVVAVADGGGGSGLQPDDGLPVALAASAASELHGRAVTVRSAAAATSPVGGGISASAGSVPGWQRRRG
jgi:hypothetical protein